MTADSQLSTPPSLPSSDPDVTLRLELGRATLSPAELTQIKAGHIVPLDADADGDITVMLDDQVAARGRLVLVNGQFCVQLSEVLTDHLFEDPESDAQE